jgi:hypothetical protein
MFVANSPKAAARKALPDDALYWRVFNFGKAAGKMIASMRASRGRWM